MCLPAMSYKGETESMCSKGLSESFVNSVTVGIGNDEYASMLSCWIEKIISMGKCLGPLETRGFIALIFTSAYQDIVSAETS